MPAKFAQRAHFVFICVCFLGFTPTWSSMDMDIRGARSDVKIEKKCCFAVDDGVKCNLGEGQNGVPNADKRSDRREPKNKQIQAFVPDDIFKVPPTYIYES